MSNGIASSCNTGDWSNTIQLVQDRLTAAEGVEVELSPRKTAELDQGNPSRFWPNGDNVDNISDNVDLFFDGQAQAP